MSHSVSGFELKFTSRRSWKAELRRYGRQIGVVPVTWTKGRSTSGGEVFQQVWFQNLTEMEKHRASKKPFVVAVAIVKDYSQHPHAVQSFQAVFEVIATGAALSENSIETKVLRRLTADKDVASA
jgi:hypothetical protein